MSMLQRRRWKVGAAVFACASPLILSFLWGLVGRSLSPFEILGTIGGVAAAVGAFTWALIPDQREETLPGKSGEFDVTTASGPSVALPKGEKQHRASDGKPPPLVAKSKVTLAEPPRPAADPGRPTARRPGEDAVKMARVEKAQGLGSSDQDISAAARIGAPIPPIQSPTHRPTPLGAIPVENEFVEPPRVRPAIEASNQNKEPPQGRRTPGERVQELRWYGKGETLSVGAYLLTDPMVYVSGACSREDEASCIDLSLDVGTPVREASGSLGYYPTYAKISPNQRANYIGWLSKNRFTPLHDIGYAFYSSMAWNGVFSSNSKI